MSEELDPKKQAARINPEDKNLVPEAINKHAAELDDHEARLAKLEALPEGWSEKDREWILKAIRRQVLEDMNTGLSREQLTGLCSDKKPEGSKGNG